MVPPHDGFATPGTGHPACLICERVFRREAAMSGAFLRDLTRSCHVAAFGDHAHLAASRWAF
jgi:hypothetical protein